MSRVLNQLLKKFLRIQVAGLERAEGGGAIELLGTVVMGASGKDSKGGGKSRNLRFISIRFDEIQLAFFKLNGTVQLVHHNRNNQV